MTTQLDLANAVTAAGGERLAGLVPGLDLEHFLDHGGSIDEGKVADLVATLLPKQKSRRGGREAGREEARRRFGIENGSDSSVKTSPAREAGRQEALKRFGTPS